MDLLEKAFTETERWEKAIDKALDKKIDKGVLDRLTSPEFRAKLYMAIKNGTYKIAPPHEAQIPKDNGDMRTVYVCENLDRVLLSVFNDLIFETCHDMIHRQCKSYQTGIGCGKVVQEVVREIDTTNTDVIGIKADLTKYFDSVPIEYIDDIFNKIETRVGKSPFIDLVRKFYHQNLCFDMNNNLVEHYFSLGQGVAFASFLADSVLYDMDKEISENYNVYYVRYSDDALIIGNKWEPAYKRFSEILNSKGLTLNPKKVETLTKQKYFKFLGFSIRNQDISLSKSRIKTFQKEVENRTFKGKSKTLTNLYNFLYIGDGEHSWATNVLSVINVKEDILVLDKFIMDCIRAMNTGKTKLGGLGYEVAKKKGVISRGTGKNVRSNKAKTEKNIPGYFSLNCMRNALLSSRAAYNTIIRSFNYKAHLNNVKPCSEETSFEKLEKLYRDFKFSTPAENFQQKSCPFYALKAEEMTDEQMVIGKDRMESLAILEAHLKKLIISGEWNGGSWYWIGNENLVLLKDWFKE